MTNLWLSSKFGEGRRGCLIVGLFADCGSPLTSGYRAVRFGGDKTRRCEQSSLTRQFSKNWPLRFSSRNYGDVQALQFQEFTRRKDDLQSFKWRQFWKSTRRLNVLTSLTREARLRRRHGWKRRRKDILALACNYPSPVWIGSHSSGNRHDAINAVSPEIHSPN